MTIVSLLLNRAYVRYVAASATALGCDLALFFGLLHMGMPAVAASGIGYAAGILVHWLISSRAVFAAEVAADGTARRSQQALFLVSALVGLGLSMAVVGLAERLGGDPRAAKLAAILLSFQAVWLLRRHVVFAR